MNKRIHNLEFRMMGTDDKPRNAEIVRWQTDSTGQEFCFTLLWWFKNREGYYVEFVGDRPFQSEINQQLLWELMRFGQNLLNAQFELEEYVDLNKSTMYDVPIN